MAKDKKNEAGFIFSEPGHKWPFNYWIGNGYILSAKPSPNIDHHSIFSKQF